MSELVEALQTRDIAIIEKTMLDEPQVSCDVLHRFGPGLYIREVHLPAGAFVVGHHQRGEHLNIFLKGRVMMLNENGSVSEMQAPMMFVGKPGRKIGYILEDVVWQNIYATTETDIDLLEEMFFEKSQQFLAHDAERMLRMNAEHEIDRQDYARVLDETGYSEDTARAQSENMDDQCDFPASICGVKVASSPIEGKGLFATSTFAANEMIAPARINGMRTPAGRYTNHSATPNAVMSAGSDGDIYLIALRSIAGCAGGQNGEEITIDYREAMRVARQIGGQK